MSWDAATQIYEYNRARQAFKLPQNNEFVKRLDKGGWEDSTVEGLAHALHVDSCKLVNHLTDTPEDFERIRKLAADISNYALMINDVVDRMEAKLN